MVPFLKKAVANLFSKPSTLNYPAEPHEAKPNYRGRIAYDAERFGFKLAGTPRHADIVVVSGPITSQSKDRLIRTLEQVPKPFVVVSLGSCPRSGNVFKGSYSVCAPLSKYVHVDVDIAGCAPKPEAIMDGLVKATEILKQKRGQM